ncbi:7708_t:CDS:2 [Funneliformis geosporum]|uniref:7708_t:CDS:1 n=1 Tax=Funneliformis geosporum TaxID=1117311 RepID=A0A9W4SE94_9GLOM|nr:7708_t:CDS:2 [Funneliformis geosporum]
MAIAPTATISNIVGCYPCIEPLYDNLYTENQIKYQGGSIQNIPNLPPSLKDKYKGAFELDPRWMIKITAERSKWIDQSISHNVFIAKPSGSELSASQVEKSTLDASKFGYTQKRDSEQATVKLKKQR